MKTALYPGSFDPVTVGHMDIIRRASRLCGTLVVAVMHNPDKRGVLTVSERIRALKIACREVPNVQIISHAGLLVDCAREVGADAVIRGIRPLGDFESEFTMAQINRELGGVETLMMPTSPMVADVSSGLVRQLAQFGGNYEKYLPDGTAEAIRGALQRQGH